eukprot:CAMPEP_0181297108 /NCGR_PEP_ID=MMETSP1101-20121128/5061_1 /TAXON_ID=46948 /ORGANISM="Rhodomonas abbreviata, Strain Caron Lab Isolate" /LENGTH=293 /DNA_ID=CAMNT_0023402017 /DNA_START=958 /DNA_END=1838 /DNA_ORIENTATION=-
MPALPCMQDTAPFAVRVCVHVLAELRGCGHAAEREIRPAEVVRVGQAKVESDVAVVHVHVQVAVLLGTVAHNEGMVLVEGGTAQVVQVCELGSDVGCSEVIVPKEKRADRAHVAAVAPDRSSGASRSHSIRLRSCASSLELVEASRDAQCNVWPPPTTGRRSSVAGIEMTQLLALPTEAPETLKYRLMKHPQSVAIVPVLDAAQEGTTHRRSLEQTVQDAKQLAGTSLQMALLLQPSRERRYLQLHIQIFHRQARSGMEQPCSLATLALDTTVSQQLLKPFRVLCLLLRLRRL